MTEPTAKFWVSTMQVVAPDGRVLVEFKQDTTDMQRRIPRRVLLALADEFRLTVRMKPDEGGSPK